jgi:quercetin dioxygenase-like cupin family protein
MPTPGGRGFVSLPGAGTTIRMMAELQTIRATGADTGGAFTVIDDTIPPGGGPPLHIHHAHDEVFYLLEGELTFRIGDQTTRAPAGTVVFVPRGTAHAFQTVRGEPARFLVVIAPGGYEGFFVELAERVAQLPPGPPDPDALRPILDRYQSAIVGPPLPPGP